MIAELYATFHIVDERRRHPEESAGLEDYTIEAECAALKPVERSRLHRERLHQYIREK